MRAVVSERFIHVRAIRHFVQHGFRVCPEPGDGPEQPAEAEREEAEALDGMRLWVLLLLGDLFREDMDEPENGDPDHRRDDEHDPGDAVRDGIERLAME